MKERKNKKYGACKGCGRSIAGGEYCSYCKERIDTYRDIQKLVLNEVKKEERKKKDRDRQMCYMW